MWVSAQMLSLTRIQSRYPQGVQALGAAEAAHWLEDFIHSIIPRKIMVPQSSDDTGTTAQKNP